MQSRTYLSDTEVAARYGNHRSWTWRKVKSDPTFPKPMKFSPGCTRWRISEIEAWETGKAVASNDA